MPALDAAYAGATREGLTSAKLERPARTAGPSATIRGRIRSTVLASPTRFTWSVATSCCSRSTAMGSSRRRPPRSRARGVLSSRRVRYRPSSRLAERFRSRCPPVPKSAIIWASSASPIEIGPAALGSWGPEESIQDADRHSCGHSRLVNSAELDRDHRRLDCNRMGSSAGARPSESAIRISCSGDEQDVHYGEGAERSGGSWIPFSTGDGWGYRCWWKRSRRGHGSEQ